MMPRKDSSNIETAKLAPVGGAQSDRGGDEPRVCARVLRNQGIDERPSSSMRATDLRSSIGPNAEIAA